MTVYKMDIKLNEERVSYLVSASCEETACNLVKRFLNKIGHTNPECKGFSYTGFKADKEGIMFKAYPEPPEEVVQQIKAVKEYLNDSTTKS